MMIPIADEMDYVYWDLFVYSNIKLVGYQTDIWGLCCRKQESPTGMNNYILQNIVGCNYFSIPEIPASVLI